jgi:hypothetical protein
VFETDALAPVEGAEECGRMENGWPFCCMLAADRFELSRVRFFFFFCRKAIAYCA